MRGSLGEKIGEGAFADVHAWAPGQVVKLFKAGRSQRAAWWEARMTRAAFAAGAPAPEVLGEVTLEGRFGIVLSRLDGPTLLQLSRTGAMTFRAGGLDPRDPRHIRSQDAPAAGRTLPARLYGPLVAGLRRQASEAHRRGHPHPDRPPVAGGRAVPLRSSPRQRDHDGGWSENSSTGSVWSARPPPSTLRSATFSFPSSSRNSSTIRSGRAATMRPCSPRYARLAGMSQAALTAAMEPYLPIVRVFALLAGWCGPAQRERLIQRVEATLRSES